MAQSGIPELLAVCDEAMERGGPERESYLDAACAGNPELRREVEAVLARHGRTAGFLDTPPWSSAAPPLTVGQRLGPYIVTGVLGAGGMGRVYRARDSRLGRTVALKVIGDAAGIPDEALARFQYVAGAIGSTVQIDSTPYVARCSSMNATITASRCQDVEIRPTSPQWAMHMPPYGATHTHFGVARVKLKNSSALFVLAALSMIAFAIPSPLIAQTQFPSDADIRDMVQPLLPTRGAGGAVIGLLEADGTRRTVTVGRTPYDGQTVFEIGSTTKVFTGLLLAEMAERGEVRLDQPVAELLPDSIRVPSRGGQQITLRDLATHTSGLPRGSRFRPADPGDPWASFTLDRLYEQVTTHELRLDIGTRYEYSNIGVGLLGHALARRAGTSYEVLVTTRILEPLGMTSTAITLDSVLQSRLAAGHDRDGNVVPGWTTPAVPGAGALRSTADDMLIFIAAHLSPPAGPLGRAIRRVQETHFTVDSSQRIGLNWQIGPLVDRTVLHHGGGTGGYRSFLVIDTTRGVGLITLTNTRANLEFVAGHLLDPRFPLTSLPTAVAVVVLTLTLFVLLLVGVAVAGRRTKAGATWRITVATLVAAAVWTLGTLLAGLHLIRPATPQPGIGVIVLASSAIAVGVGLSGVGRRLAAGLPLAALVGIQSYRLVLEVIMHRTYQHGAFPSALTVQGYTLEVAAGSSALVMAMLIAAGRADERWVRAWNWLGLGLLLNLVIIAWLNSWVAGSVFIWLPAVMLPFGILGHTIVFHRLQGAQALAMRSA